MVQSGIGSADVASDSTMPSAHKHNGNSDNGGVALVLLKLRMNNPTNKTALFVFTLPLEFVRLYVEVRNSAGNSKLTAGQNGTMQVDNNSLQAGSNIFRYLAAAFTQALDH